MKQKVLLLVVVALIGVLISGSAVAAGSSHMSPALEAILNSIEGKLDDPATGLVEIKNEVEAIETRLDSAPRRSSYGATETIDSGGTFCSLPAQGGEPGHFIMSIDVQGLDGGELIVIQLLIGGSDGDRIENVDTIGSDGLYTYEVAGRIISAWANVDDGFSVAYSMFVTY